MKWLGFTLAKLLVGIVIVALLVGFAAVWYFPDHWTGARAARLHHDLATMRELIQQFRVDNARYPVSLGELVEAGYLRRIPTDMTGSAATWVEVPARYPIDALIVDVRSGARGSDTSGTPFADY